MLQLITSNENKTESLSPSVVVHKLPEHLDSDYIAQKSSTSKSKTEQKTSVIGPRQTNGKTAEFDERSNIVTDDVTRTEMILTTLDELKVKLQELGDLLLTTRNDGSVVDESSGQMRQGGGALGISLDATSVLALLTMGAFFSFL